MPSHKILEICKKCGKPSKTVICTSCFLDYDYRAYQPEPDELSCDPAPQSSRLASEWMETDYPTCWQLEFGEEPEKENRTESTNPMVEAMDQSMDALENDSPPNADSPVSWFSRLPRFI